jgi:hypothetical protein
MTEFNFDAAERRFPAAMMKMKIEHSELLTTQAIAILRYLHCTTRRKKRFPSFCMQDKYLSWN